MCVKQTLGSGDLPGSVTITNKAGSDIVDEMLDSPIQAAPGASPPLDDSYSYTVALSGVEDVVLMDFTIVVDSPDDSGATVSIQPLDEDGNPVTDDNGEPVPPVVNAFKSLSESYFFDAHVCLLFLPVCLGC